MCSLVSSGVLILCVTFLYLGLGTSAKIAQKTVFTLYTNPASWNTANKVCQAGGGKLLKVDTKEKHKVIQHFKRVGGPWKSNMTKDRYWVGLFEQNGMYNWSGDCFVQDNWRKWKKESIEPKGGDQHCVTNGKDRGVWRDWLCNDPFPFICESYQGGGCTFKNYSGQIFKKGFNTRASVEANLSACEESCSRAKPLDTGEECWGVTHRTSPTSSCTRYFSSSASDMMKHDALQTGPSKNYTASVRICFEATINSGNIPTDLVNDSVIPFSTCFPYGNSSELLTPACQESSTHSSATTDEPFNNTGPNGSPKTTNKTVFTLYTKKASWNTANRVCQSQGGRLLKVDTLDKHRIIEHFKRNDGLWRTNMSWYWIGMFSQRFREYHWSGDCVAQKTYQNWERGQPNSLNQLCVLSNITGGKWFDSACNSRHVFICESYQQGGCTYEDHSGSTFYPSQYQPITDLPNMTCVCVKRDVPREKLTPQGRSVGPSHTPHNHALSAINSSDIPSELIDNSTNPTSTCFSYEHSSEYTIPPCPESLPSPVAQFRSTTKESSQTTIIDPVTTTQQLMTASTSVETTAVDTTTPSNSPTSGAATKASTSPTTGEATTASNTPTTGYASTASNFLTTWDATTSSISPTTPQSTSTTGESRLTTTTDAVTTTQQAIVTSTSVGTSAVGTTTPLNSPTSGGAKTAFNSPTTEKATTLPRSPTTRDVATSSNSATNKEATAPFKSSTSGDATTFASTATNEDATTFPISQATDDTLAKRQTSVIEKSSEHTTEAKVSTSLESDTNTSMRTTVKTVFTLYEEEATWNQAIKICHQRQGALLMVDSTDKEEIVDYFRKQESWKSKLDVAYWIGMFDRNPPNETFSWAVGCNRTVVNGHWTNWADGEPDRPSEEHCVMQEEHNTVWKWTTKKCKKTYQFICESHQGGNCTFENYTDKAFQLSSNHTLQRNLTECQDGCGNNTRGDECWAYMYNTTSGDCTLFFDSNPVAMMNSSLMVDSNGTIAGVRICYEATTNSSNIKASKHPEPCPPKDPPCRPMPPKMTKAESDAFMKPILDSLDVKHLYNNRKKRKYYSVPDFRPSAKGLGYAGIMLLSIVVGMIVLMDVPRLYQDARMAIHRFRELLPRNRVGDAPA